MRETRRAPTRLAEAIGQPDRDLRKANGVPMRLTDVLAQLDRDPELVAMTFAEIERIRPTVTI